jgi:hypothetical protein
MKYVIVNCKDFNGYKDVLFRLKADDFRLHDERFSSNYEFITNLKRGRVGENGKKYEIFADGSAEEVAA